MLTNLAAASTEIVAQRVFNPLYIYLDIVFLVFFCGLLIFRKKYLTLLFALAGGVLYMIVDYGIFHLALGTRSIEGGSLFWVLLWMSMSYGITNFAWIWLWMAKDKRLFEWTLLIVLWWICAPLMASSFGSSLTPIKIQRTTGAYHGAMAIILFVSYAAAIVYNLLQKKKEKRFPLLYLLIIGISVQFAWEFSLLIGGIRSAEIVSMGDKLMTLVVNSLLETNLGAVPIFCIYLFVTARFTEDLKKRGKVSFTERIAEVNRTRLREAPDFIVPAPAEETTDTVERGEE
ncbi:MAG: hypothetical protein K2L87_05265 [Clostridiales bacterium]|nr:hypothetical protein [Clostridiales bacterium]